MTALIIADLTEEERARLGGTRVRRLSDLELFRVTREGLAEISDETLERRLTEAERRTLPRQADAGYREAVAEEVLQQPEAAK